MGSGLGDRGIISSACRASVNKSENPEYHNIKIRQTF